MSIYIDTPLEIFNNLNNDIIYAVITFVIVGIFIMLWRQL